MKIVNSRDDSFFLRILHLSRIATLRRERKLLCRDMHRFVCPPCPTSSSLWMNKTRRIPTLGAERRKLRGGRCWTLSDWNLNATNLIVSRPMEDDFEVRRINQTLVVESRGSVSNDSSSIEFLWFLWFFHLFITSCNLEITYSCTYLYV